MSLLFPRWTNTVARLSAGLVLAAPVAGISALMLYVRSPLGTNQAQAIEQPIEFDHRHHVGDEGIDCRYCHQTVESGPSAGIPPTGLCLNCHSQVWNKSPLLEKVRLAYFQDRPIAWERVHNLPDFVYFNHSIHVAKGVGCSTCHGRVDSMAAITQVAPLTMSWCLECHRNPAPNLRPQDQITSMTWEPPADEAEREKQGQALAEQYHVHTRTSCTTCHR